MVSLKSLAQKTTASEVHLDLGKILRAKRLTPRRCTAALFTLLESDHQTAIEFHWGRLILENDPFCTHPIVKLFVDVQLVNIWGVVFRYHLMSYLLQRNCPQIIFQVEKWSSHPSLLPLLWHLHVKVCNTVEKRDQEHTWPVPLRLRHHLHPAGLGRAPGDEDVLLRDGGEEEAGRVQAIHDSTTHTILPRVGVQEKYPRGRFVCHHLKGMMYRLPLTNSTSNGPWCPVRPAIFQECWNEIFLTSYFWAGY